MKKQDNFFPDLHPRLISKNTYRSSSSLQWRIINPYEHAQELCRVSK